MIKYYKKAINLKHFKLSTKLYKVVTLKLMCIVGVLEKFRINAINFGCGHAFLNKLKNAI